MRVRVSEHSSDAPVHAHAYASARRCCASARPSVCRVRGRPDGTRETISQHQFSTSFVNFFNYNYGFLAPHRAPPPPPGTTHTGMTRYCSARSRARTHMHRTGTAASSRSCIRTRTGRQEKDREVAAAAADDERKGVGTESGNNSGSAPHLVPPPLPPQPAPQAGLKQIPFWGKTGLKFSFSRYLGFPAVCACGHLYHGQ